eukprot:TRINITY_DN5807_c0_g1_i1.p1 TRINITY_DN5807_c0_g1~~TRINITY_DN5807_c0_g1_i1.p1  ORF type:complete len:339 (+),score=103.87 TRINITY_DN5807_c0_g1_i1:86-1102(+)
MSPNDKCRVSASNKRHEVPRSFTNDMCDCLESDRATRRVRHAERKMKKALRRAEASERHMPQIQLMANTLSRVNSDHALVQAHNRELKEAAEVTNLLQRAERLAETDFADPEVAQLLKTLVVSENRTNTAKSTAQAMSTVASGSIEGAEGMARATLSKALELKLAALRARFCKLPVSNCTQTNPEPLVQIQDYSLVLATRRVVLTAEQSSCSQPEIKEMVIAQLRHELAEMRLWRHEEEGPPRSGDPADDGAEDTLRRALSVERHERQRDVAELQRQVDGIMNNLAQSATQREVDRLKPALAGAEAELARLLEENRLLRSKLTDRQEADEPEDEEAAV